MSCMMVTGAKSDNQSRGYQKLSSLCHAAASKRRDMQQGAQEGRQSVCTRLWTFSCPVRSDLHRFLGTTDTLRRQAGEQGRKKLTMLRDEELLKGGGGGREDSRIPSAWTPFFSCPKKKKNILNAATFPSSLLINTPHIPALKKKVHSIAIILSLPNKIIIPVIRPPRTVPYIHPKIKKIPPTGSITAPQQKKKTKKRKHLRREEPSDKP